MADKKKAFHITISSVGTDTFSAGYKRVEEKNAFTLLKRTMATIAKDLVGKEESVVLIYDLCIGIIKHLSKPEVDVNSLIKEWNEKTTEKWTLEDED